MAYQVIARKWRPQTFEEVTGQEPITRTLRGAIEHERLHHAYLFSGARGVGKTTTARLLAKALNCHRAERPTPTPCPAADERACPSCREIAEGRSIDVLEIDAASNTGVDNVRESIINTVAVRPARDRYKVFIIDEVHMLSGAAFNALLKTLEEPPSRVVFIMATTELHKVPETILSRCQQFEFRTIPLSKIAERLRLIADAEKINVSAEALREIARAGEGSMRDAQSAFDQVISFSGDSISLEDVETALGIASAELRARVMASVAAARPAEALVVVDELAMRGHDLRNFCRDLLAHLRDLLVIKVAGEGAELTDATESEQRELAREAEAFSESDLVRFFHSLTETEKALRESAHPRYQLEVGLVKLIEMRRLAPLGQILERLGALEQSLRTDARGGAAPVGSSGATSPPPAASGGSGPPPARRGRVGGGKSATASGPQEPVEAKREVGHGLPAPALKLVPPAAVELSEVTPSFDAPAVTDDRDVSDVPTKVSGAAPADHLERIKASLDDRRKPFLVVALEGARAVRLENEELYVEYAPEGKHLRDNLAKSENVRILREACREIVGHDLGVRIVVKEAGEDDGAQLSQQDEALREKQRLREMAEQHPAVQQLLRTFRGEIVDVRRIEEQ